jgi:hypothetical protein
MNTSMNKWSSKNTTKKSIVTKILFYCTKKFIYSKDMKMKDYFQTFNAHHELLFLGCIDNKGNISSCESWNGK